MASVPEVLNRIHTREIMYIIFFTSLAVTLTLDTSRANKITQKISISHRLSK